MALQSGASFGVWYSTRSGLTCWRIRSAFVCNGYRMSCTVLYATSIPWPRCQQVSENTRVRRLAQFLWEFRLVYKVESHCYECHLCCSHFAKRRKANSAHAYVVTLVSRSTGRGSPCRIFARWEDRATGMGQLPRGLSARAVLKFLLEPGH